MKKVKAYSLLEVLVVLTLIAILSAFVVPTYKLKLDRARVSAKLLPIITAYKERIEWLISTTDKDCVADDLLIYSPNKYISQFSRGCIGTSETFVNLVANMGRDGIGIAQQGDNPLLLMLIMKRNGEASDWSCEFDQAYADYVPSICR